ncbi:hypothetical protein [Actinoplanes subtropicus]|uniref:hypothetical protein n=1 Tax=Actinoplanes subtropicus TaxID=543632 RepID=UPI0004C33777|nr:hypothetical protein [Actinoplanes subtropicus]
MTAPKKVASAQPTVAAPFADLEFIVSIDEKHNVDIGQILREQLAHRRKMELRAWWYRLICLATGLSAFAFLAWFAVHLSDKGAYLEAVGVVGVGGLPMVALFVTGEVIKGRASR